MEKFLDRGDDESGSERFGQSWKDAGLEKDEKTRSRCVNVIKKILRHWDWGPISSPFTSRPAYWASLIFEGKTRSLTKPSEGHFCSQGKKLK